MIVNEGNCSGLREIFYDCVLHVFGNTGAFLDFIEDMDYSTRYSVFYDYNGETYIIDRDTGNYINWYKATHIGRDINISIPSSTKNITAWIMYFLIEFKEAR